MPSIELKVSNLPNPKLAFTNRYRLCKSYSCAHLTIQFYRVYTSKKTFKDICRLEGNDVINISSGNSLSSEDPHLNITTSFLVFCVW